jgi:large subunit ribosomal protein L19
MALQTNYKDTNFGVGDRVRVTQKIEEGGKSRSQTFEGLVLAIKGRADTRTITVRRIGEAQIGIERIFNLNSPNISDVNIVKKGMQGVKKAKLYYTRGKPKKEIETIYKRATKRKN